jgi:hypothetical protein
MYVITNYEAGLKYWLEYVTAEARYGYKERVKVHHMGNFRVAHKGLTDHPQVAHGLFA